MIILAFHNGIPNWASIYLDLNAMGPRTDEMCRMNMMTKQTYTGLLNTRMYDEHLSEMISNALKAAARLSDDGRVGLY